MEEDGPPPPRRRRQYLPLKTMPNVLGFLDIPSLLSASRVCKHWLDCSNDASVWAPLAVVGVAGRSVQAMQRKEALGRCDVAVLRRAAIMSWQAQRRLAMAPVDWMHPAQAPSADRAPHSGQPEPEEAMASPAFSTSIDGHSERARMREAAVASYAHWQQPTRTVQQDLDAAASTFFRNGGRQRSSTGSASVAVNATETATAVAQSSGALDLEWLEVQEQVMLQRVGRVTACCSELRRTFSERTDANEMLRGQLVRQHEACEQHLACCADSAIQVSAVLAALATVNQVAALTARASDRIKSFEKLVVWTLMEAFYGSDASGDDAAMEGSTRRKAIPRIAKFVELELLTLSAPLYASRLSVHWQHFKRTFPIDEAYFDLCDVVWDASDEALVQLVLSSGDCLAMDAETKESRHASVLQERWRRICLVLKRRCLNEGHPELWGPQCLV